MVILRADANGKLGRDEGTDGQNSTQNHAMAKIIGPYTVLHAGSKNRKRKRQTTAWNIPEATNDPNGDMGTAAYCQAGRMGKPTTESGHGQGKVAARST